MNKRAMATLLLLTLWLCGCEAQRIEAETGLVEAETELVEAETSQESQKALTEAIGELLTELRAERERSDRSYRETIALLTEFARSKEQTSQLCILALASVGGSMFVFTSAVMAVVMLSRRRDRTIVMVPPKQAQPWVSMGEAELVPYQAQDAIQITNDVSQSVAIGQEIAIE